MVVERRLVGLVVSIAIVLCGSVMLSPTNPVPTVISDCSRGRNKLATTDMHICDGSVLKALYCTNSNSIVRMSM